MSCLWKLLGDACTVLHPVPEDVLSVPVPNKLLGASNEGTDACTAVNKKALLALGSRFTLLCLFLLHISSMFFVSLNCLEWYNSTVCPQMLRNGAEASCGQLFSLA